MTPPDEGVLATVAAKVEIIRQQQMEDRSSARLTAEAAQRIEVAIASITERLSHLESRRQDDDSRRSQMVVATYGAALGAFASLAVSIAAALRLP